MVFPTLATDEVYYEGRPSDSIVIAFADPAPGTKTKRIGMPGVWDFHIMPGAEVSILGDTYLIFNGNVTVESAPIRYGNGKVSYQLVVEGEVSGE